MLVCKIINDFLIFHAKNKIFLSISKIVFSFTNVCGWKSKLQNYKEIIKNIINIKDIMALC